MTYFLYQTFFGLMLICLHAFMFYQYLIVILIANPLIRLYSFSNLL